MSISGSSGRARLTMPRLRGHPSLAGALCALVLLIVCSTQLAHAERTTTYFHTDAFGSTIAASDENGALLWRKEYAPYGEQIDSTAENEKLAFTGKEHDDATGLTYFGARYYDPHLGRFISMDPVGFVESNPMSFNRYAYANSNPYRFIDPDGRAVVCANKTCTMTADTFNQAKSNGQTTLATPDLRAAGITAVSQFAVKSGSKESLGFFVPDANGKPVAVSAQGVRSTSNATGATAAAAIPKNALGVIHGHIDGGRDKSNGMVDAPQLSDGYGDTLSLKANIPTATVSQGKVGWHEIKNGQLQFTYPQGALNRGQQKLMQRNLNNEQKLFHK